MENPKYTHEEQHWADDLVRRLSAEFPDAHIRTDEEHFIYEVTKPSGERVEMHTPKWHKIPHKHEDGSVTGIDTEESIRADLSGQQE